MPWRNQNSPPLPEPPPLDRKPEEERQVPAGANRRLTNPPGPAIVLEVCAESAAGAGAAELGGAQRVELCAELALGGLSPPSELLRAARAACALPIVAMVRPRARDDHVEELGALERDLERLLDLGADGVVLGCLLPDGSLDACALERLVRLAGRAPVAFHRAFDRIPDPAAALERLIELGVERVLSSGRAPSALAGAEALARLIEQAGERIAVMPGGGVRAHNARELVRRTGARELHSAVVGPGRAPGAADVRALVEALAE